MRDIGLGVIASVELFLSVLILAECNIIIESWLSNRLGQRLGFSNLIQKHVRAMLRHSNQPKKRFLVFLTAIPFYFALGLLPRINGKPTFELDESLLIFIFIMSSIPTVQFFLEGKKNPGLLERVKERSIATLGFLFLLAINLFVTTGESSISQIINGQPGGLWLIIHRPLTSLIFFGILISVYNMTQQKIFQSTQSDKIESGIEIFLQRWKAGWLMFLCTVFLGGGGPLIFIKAIIINTFSIVASSLFARLKEEQTEDLILWELGPLTVFILLLTLAVTGGW